MSTGARKEWLDFLGFAREEITPAGPVSRVVKRDGTLVPYDPAKIQDALAKVIQAVRGHEDPALAASLLAGVESAIRRLMEGRHRNSAPSVEEIQDQVEAVLMDQGQKDLAKAYILYRARHNDLRDDKNLMLSISDTMEGYLVQSDWRVKENANIGFSLGGLILHNSGSLTAHYWLRKVYPEAVARAHMDADYHIHDLSMFSGYCAGWSLSQLIREGLGGVPGRISSKPAKRLSTLMNQIVNFLGIMQNEWAGAQALSGFDTHLAPFVKAEGLDDRELRQCMQSFVFGVNTPSRWGSQAPFTNITLDWVCPADLAAKPAVVGGKDQDFAYGDCQAEMDRVNRIFLEIMLEGDAEGRGFAYPIPTYNITRDFDWDSPNARLLFEMSGRYGTPYFQNFLNSDLDPSDVRSMCCRLQLDKRELRKRGGGLFGSDELTGSIGVVTLNLPRVGYLAKDRSDFFERLNRVCDLAAQSLAIKRRVVGKLMDGGLFPWTRRYLPGLDNHFSTIGICGMHEACLNFLGAGKGIETAEGRAFALEVLDHLRDRLAGYQEQYGDMYNLEASPAESTSFRLALHDRREFPDIVASGTADSPYYTNSTQLPVDHTADIFDALDHQEELQSKYTGGTVFHTLLGEEIRDWKSCRSLVKAIASTYRIPYFTISPVFSVCPAHGYLKGHQERCPDCGAETEVYSRIVGYYRSLANWNQGKRTEYDDRLHFELPEGSPRGEAPGGAAEALQERTGKTAARKDPARRKSAGARAETGSADRAEISPADGLSWLLFQRDRCPQCPPMKHRVTKMGLPGRMVDTDTEEGFALARDHDISSTPTLVMLDAEGREVRRIHGVHEWRELRDLGLEEAAEA